MQGNYSEEAGKQREILLHLGFSICDTWPDGEYDIIIDALLGIGITGEVRGKARAMIRKINEYRCSFQGKTSFHGEKAGAECLNGISPVICAVDLPSGIGTDTGAVCGEAVKADLTVTFQYLKKAHLLYPGKEYCGRVYLRDVGIENYGICAETAFTYEKEEAKKNADLPLNTAILKAKIGARADTKVLRAEQLLRRYGRVHQMLQSLPCRICAASARTQE